MNNRNTSAQQKENLEISLTSDDDDIIDLINFSENFKKLIPKLKKINPEDKKKFQEAEKEKFKQCQDNFNNFKETIQEFRKSRTSTFAIQQYNYSLESYTSWMETCLETFLQSKEDRNLFE